MKNLSLYDYDSTLALIDSPIALEANASDTDETGMPDISADTASLFELLSRMKGMTPTAGEEDDEDMSDFDDEDDEDNDAPNQDADDFHNEAVDYARRGRYRQAAAICMRGLKFFPKNVDLLADTVKYSASAGDQATADRYFQILRNSIPFSRWNWRAYNFTLDYLIESDPAAHEQECRLILANFRQSLPYEERTFVTESELESALGNHERAMEVLAEAIHTRSNACMSALNLADMQLERGLYAEVVKTASYGIAAAADPQPSINIPYLYYIRALAKDHLLHRRALGLEGEEAESVTVEEVEAMRKEYELMLSEFPELRRHAGNIQMRLRMLKFLAA